MICEWCWGFFPGSFIKYFELSLLGDKMYKEIVLSYDKSLTAREITSLRLFNESFKNSNYSVMVDVLLKISIQKL